ncbi:MAG: 3-oxoacyl-ACP reductase FabG [Deltaproteobacteria bacterium]|nr:3-oxoacyl-ACP reductase FabG [Deltaproteobacteria bacterium]
MRLKDKVMIITGAGQGIGAAYARRTVEEGAKVVVADINGEKAQAVAGDITAKGHEAMAVKTDVSDENSTRNLVQKVVDTYGRVDVLINNAGIFSTIKLKPAEEISVQEWDQLMGVNLRGVFLCCKAVIPFMKKQKQGKIINISSATVFMGKPWYIHYVSSKAGVIGFTRALARELGDFNIQVNCMTPGYTETEIPRGTTTPEQLKAIINHQCMKRIGVPEDLFGVIIYLASNESDFMSGQTVNVDGGDNFI